MYRATAGDCLRCPIRQQCTRGPKRTLSVPFDEAVRQDVIALQNTEAFQDSRRLRKKVEILFAHSGRSPIPIRPAPLAGGDAVAQMKALTADTSLAASDYQRRDQRDGLCKLKSREH
jgi:hypothetical protein